MPETVWHLTVWDATTAPRRVVIGPGEDGSDSPAVNAFFRAQDAGFEAKLERVTRLRAVRECAYASIDGRPF